LKSQVETKAKKVEKKKASVVKSKVKLTRALWIGLAAGLLCGIILVAITASYTPFVDATNQTMNGESFGKVMGTLGSGWMGILFTLLFLGGCPIFGYWVAQNGHIHLLFHEDPYYRVGGYIAFGIILILFFWAVFFFLIKAPNLLSESFMVKKFFKPAINENITKWGESTFKAKDLVGVWGNILWLTVKNFLNHLVFVVLFIFLMNGFKIGRFHLGFVYLILYTVMWGIAMGTNSLEFPGGNNPMAGPIIVFGRYGLWIWFSYLLLVASTLQFNWLTAPSWQKWEWKLERPKPWPVSFTPEQKELFIYGLLFLLAASFAEARLFVHYNFM
jgi:MFS family permease